MGSTDEFDPDSMTEYGHFIDGAFRSSADADRIEVRYPYTGAAWASVPVGTEADVDAAVSAARRAFRETWCDRGPGERSELLYDVADVAEEHADELARIETYQNGKPYAKTKQLFEEIGEWFRFHASLCNTLEGRTIPVDKKGGALFNYVQTEPLGVVGGITPWNSPLLTLTSKLAPAIAAGNTFVHKPSEYTPVSALRFAEILSRETGLPDGVYNVVTGPGRPTGEALADHGDVDMLAFTGSTAVGREIGEKAGRRIIPTLLELGGKSPNIVFPSANLENAVLGAIKGIFAAAGQSCVAGSRLFVHDDVYDEFVAAFADRAEAIRLGDPMDADTEVGPITYREQWEKVMRYIDVAERDGATVRSGGGPPDGMEESLFVRPTILEDVENDMAVAQEEIFGPVSSVLRFSSEAEVVEKANDVSYGLASGVWTEDMRQAHRVADQLEAGVVWVNEYRTVSYRSPIGGYKESGLGRVNGRETFERYRQTKSVWIDLAEEVSDPFSLAGTE